MLGAALPCSGCGLRVGAGSWSRVGVCVEGTEISAMLQDGIERNVMNEVEVTISEVGPRDGLQNTKSFMPTEVKKAWISAEAAAGVHEIEVCSFVPAKLIPQFVDAEEVLTYANSVAGLTPVVLVPNFKGCERAIAAGGRRITVPISVSEAHSMNNVRKTTAQAPKAAA